MKKKSKNKLDNGAIAKLASITSSAITTFKEKQKQKQKLQRSNLKTYLPIKLLQVLECEGSPEN